MRFVFDPSILVKINKMKQRVQWKHPLTITRSIDQTRLAIDDGWDRPDFSFLVIGDTGSGPRQHQNPQRRVAEQMLSQVENSRFILHTGDVVYLVGSSEYYADNFINPYREFIVGGEQHKHIAYDQMVFKLPFLPIPGNHDYYDLTLLQGVLAGVTLPIRRLLKSQLDFDVGWHGSYQGKAYAQAFLDYLCRFQNGELAQHLDQHYTADVDGKRCLRYQPGQFTRLPNRYYTFRYGNIDFFAIDSNTFNAPQPIPKTREGNAHRRSLEQQRDNIEQERLKILESTQRFNPDHPDDSQHLSDLQTKLEQLGEVKLDIEKQLETQKPPVIDHEQLDWLYERLVESWHTSEVGGRVVYFHHPPYVTEATKWHQAQTLTVRKHIRQVFDRVAADVKDIAGDRPVVDLVLNGHAHCLEYIRTFDTGHADANMNWIVCGGSGYSLRRQRQEGPDLTETFNIDGSAETRLVARSHFFVGRNGQGSFKRRPYSFLRIDVQGGTPPKFVVQPFVVEQFQHQWSTNEPDALIIGG